MTIGEYIRLVLTKHAAVSALVVDRVYADVLPQKPKMPALVYSFVGGEDDYALDGPTGATVRRVQLDAWAETRAGADALHRAAMGALSGHTGGAEGLVVDGIFRLSTASDYEPETKLYRQIDDYEVHASGTES